MIDIQLTRQHSDEVTTSQALLTPRQAAAFLNVPIQTLAIWRCTKRVALKWVKVGRHVRYRMCDLLSFLEANAQGAA